MQEIKVESEELTTSLSNLTTELDNLTKTANNIANQADIISNSSIWQGKKAASFNKSLESFLPNIAIAYNMMEKSKDDLTNCINNMVKHDQG